MLEPMDRETEAIDPVCGMSVGEKTAAGRLEHNGARYLFCSQHCLERFRAAPERFARPTESAGEATPRSATQATPEPSNDGRHAGVIYTCPMHPEVVRDGPGACPICGMALEPRTAAAVEAPDP